MKGQQTQHTPGPWHHERTFPNSFEVFQGNLNRICSIDHWGPRQTDLTSDLKPEGEPEANARLIAAAPELLAACQRLIAYDDTVPDRPSGQIADGQKLVDAIKLAMAAVAKATQS